MADNERYFVEWKEQYVSKERGNRVVHYFLKDNSGESILTVVGTERSVRHMFYVVADKFLSIQGSDNSVHAGFRWRSRREVVNWLTSMLSKQHTQGDYTMSLQDDPTFELNAHKAEMTFYKGSLAKTLKGGNHLAISWSGSAWICGKQLKHYSAFCRNGISIPMQSFVFIMAEQENRYIAYLEDIYEDKKCQKKVKVRWFHYNREVKGIASLRNPHPREIFITPYVQVISAECVDGPAIVLTREHYEKCMEVFPHDLLGRVHFCFRQFKNSRVKPFKLNKLGGYFDQPIFSCFSPDFFEEKDYSSEDGAKVGAKRNINCLENQKMTCELLNHKLKCGLPDKEQLRYTPVFALNEKVEFLCQDSGIRGCWFKCRVLEISKRQIKILYDDIKDEDIFSNLEEWIPIYRVAKADRLGMRNPGRPTIRPAHHCNERKLSFEVGDPADAWWSDGWWEGVITVVNRNGSYEIYVSGENLYMNVELKNLRVSRDWVGDRWVDVKANPDILRNISSSATTTTNNNNIDTKTLIVSSKDTKSDDNSPTSCYKVVRGHKLSTVDEEEIDGELTDMTLTNGPSKDECNYDEHHQQQIVEAIEDKENYSEHDVVNEEENTRCDLCGANVLTDTNGNNNGGDEINDSNGENKSSEDENTEPRCETTQTMEMLT